MCQAPVVAPATSPRITEGTNHTNCIQKDWAQALLPGPNRSNLWRNPRVKPVALVSDVTHNVLDARVVLKAVL